MSTATVVRINRTTNPRPASADRWRVSGGETVTFIANDRGKPALEFLDPVGDGGLYGDPQDNYQPALGQYAAFGYDLCALDAQTADRMRVIWSGYSGDTPSPTSLLAPLERPRINLCTDPRATAAARWSAAGTAYSITETMVTGATDGPVLPDGSQVTTYARYTMGATGDGTNTWYGYSPVAPAGTPYPAGTKAVLAIYARPSRRQVNARLYGRAYGAAGAIVDPLFGDYATLEAGQWTRLAMVHTSTQAVGDWLPYAHVSAPTWQPGDTMDVTAVLIEPFAETITPHFDAAMAATSTVEPVWAGTPNASVSRGLRPYQRIVHATRLTAYDPAGYLRALVWPNPQVAYPGSGFRVREAVVAFADTEDAARAAVAAFFDGATPTTTLPDGSTLVRTWSGAANASSSIETRVPALLSAYVEPDQARVRLEVYGGDPGAALYLFRRDSAGVGIVRDTSEGTAGFPELVAEDRNNFPYPKPATVDGWATPNGATLAVVDSGSGVPALTVSRATVGDGSVWGPGAEPDLPVTPVVGTPLRIVAEWMPQHAASYALALVTVDAAGAVLETVATSTVVVAAGSTGTWRTVTLTGTPAVAGAVYARLRIVPTYTSPNRAPNPSFETDAANVQLAIPSSMVIERGAAGATDGANALRVSLVAPVSQYMYSGERVAAGAVGTWVGFSVDVSAQAGSAFLRPALVFRDASGTQVGSTVLGSFVTATTTPQRIAITGQVPSGATQVDAVVYPHSSTAAAAPVVGTATTLDALMITTGAASSAAATTASATYRPPPVGELYRLRRILQGPGAVWFDGDSTTATPGYGYDWLGANDASPSVFGAYAAGQFHDYEARQGESTDYLLADGDGNLLAAVTVAIPLWGTWLKSPGRPSRNVRCFFGSEEEVRRRARREAYDVEGSAQVTITAGVRARPEGQLTLVTREAETARAMNLLLDDGATLMLDTPPSWGVSFRYLSVGDVAIVRPLTAADGFQGLTGEARLFQLADVVSEAVPAGVTAQDPGRTYATVASLFATYAAIAATVATYDDLATGGQ